MNHFQSSSSYISYVLTSAGILHEVKDEYYAKPDDPVRIDEISSRGEGDRPSWMVTFQNGNQIRLYDVKEVYYTKNED
jgi:hypothetical protein